MDAKKKRLTLDLDAAIQRRLKSTAALKGVSMREYCQAAIEKELSKDEARVAEGQAVPPISIEQLIALSKEILGGRTLPGDSAEIISEAREERALAIERALKGL